MASNWYIVLAFALVVLVHVVTARNIPQVCCFAIKVICYYYFYYIIYIIRVRVVGGGR